MNKRYVTKLGLEKITKELGEFKKKRVEIVERIKAAKELGDLRENSEYTDARDAQAFNEAKILELEEMLKNIEVVENDKGSGVVTVGSVVRVKSVDKAQDFELVGASEAKPIEGKISVESPLGQSFLGHRVGDEVIVRVPKGDIKYKILDIK